MQKNSISLCLIVKNEENNIPQLFESVRGCFDEIVLVDTGSTDKTVELAKVYAEKIGTEINVQHFTWINDFSAARNHSLSFAKSEFIMWMDGDDVMDGRDSFIEWKKCGVQFADYWLANYDYALNPDGTAAITFSRERVFRNGKGFKFSYFIHEGVKPDVPGVRAQFITTWRIKHMRTQDDMMKDRSRNIQILESRLGELDTRLKFYYGKEAFEAGQFEKALSTLVSVSAEKDLDNNDRILALQYACYSQMALADRLMPEFRGESYARLRQLAHQGLQLAPNRAEFHFSIGESFIKEQRLNEALPFFAAASNCVYQKPGEKYSGAIFNFAPVYFEVPKIEMAKIFFHTQQLEKSRQQLTEVFDATKNEQARIMLQELDNITPLITLKGPKTNVPDIVITCPPQQAYEFDEEKYKTQGMGGSETALILMAKHLKKLTGRPVKVFNMREKPLVCESGVEYIPTTELNRYMADHMPSVHVAWRHNIKMTNAPTYLWCHDLVTPGCEVVHNFDYMMCLTEFHKEYVRGMQGIPENQIIVTRNGLDSEKFNFERKPKNPNKILWMSSPDRGLDRAILVTERARKEFPDLELHVYYGLDNLYKFGLTDLANKLRHMMAERPWVKYHGFTEQSKMYREVSDGVIWLHPCDFIETSCITANEMLALGVYPVTRSLGGLRDTLKAAVKAGMATMLDCDCVTEEEFEKYTEALKHALVKRSWERVKINPFLLDWVHIAKEWMTFMPIFPLEAQAPAQAEQTRHIHL